jgi:hypothetical protein
MTYQKGDRIQISKEYHWAKGATGTINTPPGFLLRISEEDGEPWVGCHRFVKGVKGPIEFYWVWFDYSQTDADGDGPYKGGEIHAWAIDQT